MKNKWEVMLKGNMNEKGLDLDDFEEEEFGFELSVIRKNNKHGHDSWGWGDENKIILFGTGLGENSLPEEDVKAVKFAKRIAQLLCDVLNTEDIYL